MVARRAQPVLQQARGQPSDHVVILGVDHDECALAPRQRQDIEHLPVIQLQQIVGHVDLERGVAVADQSRKLLAHDLLGRVGDDQMKGVVDDRLGAGRFVIFLHYLAQGLTTMLRSERDHRGGAAERSGHGRAVEIVGADNPGGRALLDVAMAVDPTGKHQLAPGVDLARPRSEPEAKCGDNPILDANIASRRVSGGRHRAVADDEIEVAHRFVPSR